ncbi:hypothetical protein PsAD46_03012 [Pseudovibrio sp. Ad46]|nr:hypothetical protein PsAD46_03012 [Pseudovibrio sp. Ad46]
MGGVTLKPREPQANLFLYLFQPISGFIRAMKEFSLPTFTSVIAERDHFDVCLETLPHAKGQAMIGTPIKIACSFHTNRP